MFLHNVKFYAGEVQKYGVIYTLLLLVFQNQDDPKKKLTRRRARFLDWMEKQLNKWDGHMDWVCDDYDPTDELIIVE